mmetsp:Transcript_113546/g.367332  ORF Transcript_113546/g.367332 Transcript_113546/m.367332 type:complete len:664 (-) Transcript_113546:3295-5286(-)
MREDSVALWVLLLPGCGERPQQWRRYGGRHRCCRRACVPRLQFADQLRQGAAKSALQLLGPVEASHPTAQGRASSVLPATELLPRLCIEHVLDNQGAPGCRGRGPRAQRREESGQGVRRGAVDADQSGIDDDDQQNGRHGVERHSVQEAGQWSSLAVPNEDVSPGIVAPFRPCPRADAEPSGHFGIDVAHRRGEAFVGRCTRRRSKLRRDAARDRRLTDAWRAQHDDPDGRQQFRTRLRGSRPQDGRQGDLGARVPSTAPQVPLDLWRHAALLVVLRAVRRPHRKRRLCRRLETQVLLARRRRRVQRGAVGVLVLALALAAAAAGRAEKRGQRRGRPSKPAAAGELEAVGLHRGDLEGRRRVRAGAAEHRLHQLDHVARQRRQGAGQHTCVQPQASPQATLQEEACRPPRVLFEALLKPAKRRRPGAEFVPNSVHGDRQLRHQGVQHVDERQLPRGEQRLVGMRTRHRAPPRATQGPSRRRKFLGAAPRRHTREAPQRVQQRRRGPRSARHARRRIAALAAQLVLAAPRREQQRATSSAAGRPVRVPRGTEQQLHCAVPAAGHGEQQRRGQERRRSRTPLPRCREEPSTQGQGQQLLVSAPRSPIQHRSAQLIALVEGRPLSEQPPHDLGLSASAAVRQRAPGSPRHQALGQHTCSALGERSL